MASLTIDASKCCGCAKCIERCPANVLALHDLEAKKVAVAENEKECCACGACVLICSERAIVVEGQDILKVEPTQDYPPEEGRYLRGNDFSPVAVAAILDTYDFKIPEDLTNIITSSIEAGAALSGTLQTENIGIEKIIANIVANPNIRFLILCWREAEGHRPAEAIQCLVETGVADDKRRTIIGATAPAPYLPNISLRAIERFRKQITIVNMIREDDGAFAMLKENVCNGVHACIQEEPTEFLDYLLYDPGAWPEPAICESLAMRITEPWRPELSSKEAQIIERMKTAARAKPESQEEARIAEEREMAYRKKVLLELLGLDNANNSDRTE